jgi:hypothetical protein
MGAAGIGPTMLEPLSQEENSTTIKILISVKKALLSLIISSYQLNLDAKLQI